MNVKTFFTDEQSKLIQQSIADAERMCSGEIRVHIDIRCKGDVMAQAKKVFEKLKMHKTAERNGVLIYLALADKKLAILGDKGINEKVPEGFWDLAYSSMKKLFAEANYTEGLQVGIGMAGEKLRTYFPYQKDDSNELSNEISYGE
jgi:uncharacterized membrane protein